MGQPPASSMVSSHCTHCGDACGKDTVTQGQHTFCCSGCATVYSILKDNNLLDFYRIDDRAGAKQQAVNDRDYAWLEVPKLAERFVRYRDDTRCHVELELPGIHCSSCIWLLERLPQLLPGVRSCSINFSNKLATIVFDPRVLELRQVAEMLDRIGYPPHFRVQGEVVAGKTNRALIYRIGVAGFCFGNIMLLSFPEYFGLSEMLAGAGAGARWVGEAMNYLLLVLSLPVVLYAGRGFFTTAWYAVRSRQVTIDLPIALGMLALFGRSVYEIIAGVGSGYLDSLAGLVFFLLIGRWFQTYSFARLNFDRDYRDYFPVAAYREAKDGTPEPVASEDLAAGDILSVRPGNLIPADGRLLSPAAHGIDYSFVTGEAAPRPANEGDEVFAGGRATSSSLRIAVTKPPDQSYLLQLWLREGENTKRADVAPPEWLIRIFTATILLLAAGTLAYWYQTDTSLAYRAATAVLIIACPCALALAAPFAYGTLQRLLARSGYYFRGPAVIERLGKTDTFVFDKTGTLTEEQKDTELTFVMPRSADYEAVFLAMARQSSHPRSQAISEALASGEQSHVHPRIGNVTERTGQGILLEHQGHNFRIGSPAFCGFPHYQEGTFAVVDDLLCFSLKAQQTVLRDGIDEMLYSVGESGDTWLLSGDQPPADPFWEPYLAPEKILFRQTPFNKRSHINDLQRRNAHVLMVGDGLNDAGALATANVGLAVNEDEARFNPACDGIVKSDRLTSLPDVLLASGRMKWVMIITYLLAFAYNVVGLSYAVTGALSPVIAAILMPLSSVTIVIVASLGAGIVYQKSVQDQANDSKYDSLSAVTTHQ
ncbi:HAD-IC family P-type ATPase [Neolewinella aurantiaca]|uniref:HAD-IC family P-type ATPase n=1 Tax=Neolewinella aurantiaca TaxID=2602767 RepID=A0A5C7FX70_9BACT|nr:heavy metal translocating P-type ATPase metal-binding domain-containing protein [Neolewinella aurantiaca]TXF91040.1 HAD-IC family P-type ATPase [Neolewinella aurantiaca]